jgi:uncharacterized protein (DUF2141 family)
MPRPDKKRVSGRIRMRSFVASLLLLGLLPGTALAADPARIIVVVENVEDDSGSVKVALCNKALSEDGCQFVQEVPAVPGAVTVTFENIAPGPWAVAAFHDKNKSGAMDKTFIGTPTEPYALSNKATEHMIPTLKDAIVKIKSGDNEIHVTLGMFMK